MCNKTYSKGDKHGCGFFSVGKENLIRKLSLKWRKRDVAVPTTNYQCYWSDYNFTLLITCFTSPQSGLLSLVVICLKAIKCPHCIGVLSCVFMAKESQGYSEIRLIFLNGWLRWILLSVLHSHWWRNVEARLSLVESPMPALSCLKEPAQASKGVAPRWFFMA